MDTEFWVLSFKDIDNKWKWFDGTEVYNSDNYMDLTQFSSATDPCLTLRYF